MASVTGRLEDDDHEAMLDDTYAGLLKPTRSQGRQELRIGTNSQQPLREALQARPLPTQDSKNMLERPQPVPMGMFLPCYQEWIVF